MGQVLEGEGLERNLSNENEKVDVFLLSFSLRVHNV